MSLDIQYPILLKLLNVLRRSQRKTCFGGCRGIAQSSDSEHF